MKTAWLRNPVLQFTLIGAALFVLERAWPERRAPIAFSGEQVAALEARFEQQYGVRPTPAQRQALVRQAADEEALVREARALGLDRGDPSVRLRLVQKMRSLSDRPARSDDELYREAVALGLEDDAVVRRILVRKIQLLLEESPPVTEAELRAYVEAHRDRYALDATVSFAHVFLASATRAGAEARLAELRSGGVKPEDAVRGSDPFPLGWRQRARSREELASRFDPDFARVVFALPAGQWSGPIASPYGLHLIYVEQQLPERLPPLEDLRAEATSALQHERAEQTFAGAMARLRERYGVQP